jgi:hypothetical protein
VPTRAPRRRKVETLTRAEARTAIRAATDQEASDETAAQVLGTQLNTWLDLEHKLFRRELSQAVPSLYTATGSEHTPNATTGALTMPSDYERLVRVELKVGANWYPVDVASDGLSPHLGDLCVREEGGTLYLAPVTTAAAYTVRIVYVQSPGALSADSGANGVLLVPEGCEDIICARVEARVQVRFQRDPSPHAARAAAVWREQRKYLRKRYGATPVPGLRTTGRW